MDTSLRAQYREEVGQKEGCVKWSVEAQSVVSEKLRLEVEAETELKRALKRGQKKKRIVVRKEHYDNHKAAQDLLLPTAADQCIVAQVLSLTNQREFRHESKYILKAIPQQGTKIPTPAEISALSEQLRPKVQLEDLATKKAREAASRKHKIAWD